MQGGLKWERFKRKDHNFHKIFGAAPSEPILPLNRSIDGLPLIYQGQQNSCVSCSVTWIKQYLEQDKPSLSWPFLAEISNTASDGATPKQVLDPARTIGIVSVDKFAPVANDPTVDIFGPSFIEEASKHKIGGYSFLTKLDKESLYQALKISPLAIGVEMWQGVGPHMMAAFDVTEDGTALKCANWWDASKQDIQIVPFEIVSLAVAFHDKATSGNFRMSIFDVLKDAWSMCSWKSVLISSGLFLLLIGSLFSGGKMLSGQGNQKLGASGVAAFYSTTIGGAGVNSTVTTIPVSSITLFTGEVLYSSNLIFPAYLVLDPNSNSSREIVECWGLNGSSTPIVWTGCNRGMTALGTNTTSTVSGKAYAHAPGTAVIMSNVPAYFNRYVDVYTAQSVTGTKRFTTDSMYLGNASTSTKKKFYFSTGQALDPYLFFSGTSTMGFAADGLSEMQFNANGTTFGVSPTGGLFLSSGLLGINVSTTASLAIDSNNFLYVNSSSTASLNGGYLKNTAAGKLYWDLPSFLSSSLTFTGTTTFTGAFSVSSTVTGTTQVANQGYVDYAVSSNTATGTAAMTIAVGNALYETSSSTLALSDSDATSTSYNFVGIALTAASAGQQVSFAKFDGIVSNQSGLVAGRDYYLSGTSGALSLTAGTVPVKVGLAISTTGFYIKQPSKFARVTGSTSLCDGSTPSINLGWRPNTIRLLCGSVANINHRSMGEWHMASNGSISQWAFGNSSDGSVAIPYATSSIVDTCHFIEGGTTFSINVTSTQTGFTLSCGNPGVLTPVQYVAEYEDY